MTCSKKLYIITKDKLFNHYQKRLALKFLIPFLNIHYYQVKKNTKYIRLKIFQYLLTDSSSPGDSYSFKMATTVQPLNKILGCYHTCTPNALQSIQRPGSAWKLIKKKYHLFIKIKKKNVKYIHISHINQNLIEIVRFNCIPIHYKIWNWKTLMKIFI